MDTCKNCNALMPHLFLPSNYGSLPTLDKAVALKNAIKVLEDEHKMYRESYDIDSMLATEKEIDVARSALKHLLEEEGDR